MRRCGYVAFVAQSLAIQQQQRQQPSAFPLPLPSSPLACSDVGTADAATCVSSSSSASSPMASPVAPLFCFSLTPGVCHHQQRRCYRTSSAAAQKQKKKALAQQQQKRVSRKGPTAATRTSRHHNKNKKKVMKTKVAAPPRPPALLHQPVAVLQRLLAANTAALNAANAKKEQGTSSRGDDSNGLVARLLVRRKTLQAALHKRQRELLAKGDRRQRGRVLTGGARTMFAHNSSGASSSSAPPPALAPQSPASQYFTDFDYASYLAEAGIDIDAEGPAIISSLSATATTDMGTKSSAARGGDGTKQQGDDGLPWVPKHGVADTIHKSPALDADLFTAAMKKARLDSIRANPSRHKTAAHAFLDVVKPEARVFNYEQQYFDVVDKRMEAVTKAPKHPLFLLLAERFPSLRRIFPEYKLSASFLMARIREKEGDGASKAAILAKYAPLRERPNPFMAGKVVEGKGARGGRAASASASVSPAWEAAVRRQLRLTRTGYVGELNAIIDEGAANGTNTDATTAAAAEAATQRLDAMARVMSRKGSSPSATGPPTTTPEELWPEYFSKKIIGTPAVQKALAERTRAYLADDTLVLHDGAPIAITQSSGSVGNVSGGNQTKGSRQRQQRHATRHVMGHSIHRQLRRDRLVWRGELVAKGQKMPASASASAAPNGTSRRGGGGKRSAAAAAIAEDVAAKYDGIDAFTGTRDKKEKTKRSKYLSSSEANAAVSAAAARLYDDTVVIKKKMRRKKNARHAAVDVDPTRIVELTDPAKITFRQAAWKLNRSRKSKRREGRSGVLTAGDRQLLASFEDAAYVEGLPTTFGLPDEHTVWVSSSK